jgi:adenylate cyclase
MTQPRSEEPRRDVDLITQWVLGTDRRNESAIVYFEGLCTRILEAGVPLSFCSTSISTMNPEVAVQNLRWKKEHGIESFFRPHVAVHGPKFDQSPIAAAQKKGGRVHCPLERPLDEIPYPICRELAQEGATDYVLEYFPYRRGHGFMSFGTDQKGGFSKRDLALIQGLVPAVAVRNELFSQHWALESLLKTYLGRNASNRVLGGDFQRGTGEKIRAVIWMSDLRNFTQKVDNEPLDDVIASLDQYFSCLALPIMEHGGEVLKFIGDAVLGIFPLDKGWPRSACAMALTAAEEAFASMEKLNLQRASTNRAPMHFGLVLHVGEVMYGNIGTPDRLDFTVIGPAVNEASRIEGLCKKLGHPLLITQDFAQLAEREDLVGLGKHSLRGVSHEVDIFTLPDLEQNPGRDHQG